MLNGDGKKGASPATLAAFAEVEQVLKTTQRSALQLFGERGVVDGRALNEWLTAERDTGWPATEFVERETEYLLRIALPGVDPSTIELSTEPRELIIRTKNSTDKSARSRARDLWRRRDLPVDFRSENAKATLDNGILTIIAPKGTAAENASPALAVRRRP